MASNNYPHRIVVDGEQWAIHEDEEHPGLIDLRWMSGPAGGSGITTRTNFRGMPPMHFIENQVRDYMHNVNPETGYLD